MAEDTKSTAEEEVIVVLIEGPNGEEEYYAQDVIIPYEGKEFAILVSVDEDDSDAEPEIIVARMDQDDDGEIVYVSPEEDEFTAVEKLYNEMFAEEE